jgi:predicted transcriptional regulator
VRRLYGLVRSGFIGGFSPPPPIYEELYEINKHARRNYQETDPVPVYLNNRLSSVTLQELKFKPPNSGIFRVSGDIRDFKTGDRINISSEKLIVHGRVVGRDDMSNSLLSSVEVAFFRE